jgi:hypothetical protein
VKVYSKCKLCGVPWIPDNRHVSQNGVEDCTPSNGLDILEIAYDKKKREQK